MATARTLDCIKCTARITISDEDPDAALSDLWEHLGRHTRDQIDRQRLFVQVQVNTRRWQ